MGNERTRNGMGFFLFTLAVIIHNTFAPKEFRRELNEYSIKCYCILVLLWLAIWFFVEQRAKRQERKAIEEEKERVRKIREYMERIERRKEEEKEYGNL